MNSTLQGLQVSLLALLITFLALGVFILVMILLQRLFPARPEQDAQPSGEESAAQEETAVSVISADDSEEGQIVAAIAAALAHVRATNGAQLGESLRAGRGGWWAAQRAASNQGPVQRR